MMWHNFNRTYCPIEISKIDWKHLNVKPRKQPNTRLEITQTAKFKNSRLTPGEIEERHGYCLHLHLDPTESSRHCGLTPGLYSLRLKTVRTMLFTPDRVLDWRRPLGVLDRVSFPLSPPAKSTPHYTARAGTDKPDIPDSQLVFPESIHLSELSASLSLLSVD